MADNEEAIQVKVTTKKKKDNPKIKSSSTPIMTKSVDEEESSDGEEQTIVSRTNKVVNPIGEEEKSSIKIIKDDGDEDAQEKDESSPKETEVKEAEKESEEAEAESKPADDEPSKEPDTEKEEPEPQEEESQVDEQEALSSDNADEDNPLGPTVADLASHTETMDAHNSRDYKITPAKLKKSPSRSRQQKLSVATTVIVFAGIVAMIFVGLWMFLPGFDETLSNLFA